MKPEHLLYGSLWETRFIFEPIWDELYGEWTGVSLCPTCSTIIVNKFYCSKICKKIAYTKRRRKAISEARKDIGVTLSYLMKKYNSICQQCGCEVGRFETMGYIGNRATIEHIIPLSEGGEHSFENTTLLCFDCNVKNNEERIKLT